MPCWTSLPSPVISTTGHCFCFGSVSSLFLELFLHSSPVAYWAPTDLDSSSFSVVSLCLFILFHTIQSRRVCTHLLLRELQNYNLLLNNHQQENVGSHQKKIPCIQGQRRSPNTMVGGAQLCLIKLHTLQRCSEGTNKTCTPGPVERSSDSHKRLSQTCLRVFECTLWMHESAVPCHGGRGSGCSRPRRFGMWHQSSWRRSPLAPP